MNKASLRPILLLIAVSALPAAAQWVPQRYTLTPAERQELTAGRDSLREDLAKLKGQVKIHGIDRLPDAEIYLDAVDRELGQNLFFVQGDVARSRACLTEGKKRAEALAAGQAPWDHATGVVVQGYRSKVDGSAQPFQVIVPEAYDFAKPKATRLDLFLHGRGGNLSEINFINNIRTAESTFGGSKLPYLVLFPYGRGNNGWRFAGERDAFEALDAVKARYSVDADHTSVRGFSMGGHGCWHIGLQHPGEWSVMSPGAGFTDTIQYQKITDKLPDWQMSLLHMYDPVDWVTNGRNLPVLAYVGENDPARSQHELIVSRFKSEGAPFKEFIGPKTGHAYEPATRTQLLEELAQPKRHPNAPEVDFVTYTLRFPECKWVRVEGLEHHWERSEVHARALATGRLEVTTKNVTALDLTVPPALAGKGRDSATLAIDGANLPLNALKPGKTVSLLKQDGKWIPGEPKGLRKKPGVTGPIDDALFGPVVAVAGTGSPWSAPMDRWTKQELQRFRDGWGEFFRATLPERTDQSLSRDDIRNSNLYLFGDPGSNAVLRRLLPKLPLKWTQDQITVVGKSFSTKDHLPMLVFPNPESPEHYVVINCGFSFSREDWHGSNARQYAHLPDYAVIRYDPEHFADDRSKDTELAGFFNERWQ